MIRGCTPKKTVAKTSRLSTILLIIIMLVFSACAGVKSSKGTPDPLASTPGYKTYLYIRSKLNTGANTLDYDTLMDIYNTMVKTDHPHIPHTDQLLNTLVKKRNDDPRVDQMILIFAARVIKKSSYPIPDVRDIFQTILSMGDDRINGWVISYVGSAIGGYEFNIPDGDGLVDLLDERLDQVEAVPAGSREYFGYHFLPPPKSEFIRSYIAGIEDKHTRETERAYYYALIMNDMTEEEIKTAVIKLQTQGIPGTGAKCSRPMRYLISNLNRPRKGM